jgi:hypothetical protein
MIELVNTPDRVFNGVDEYANSIANNKIDNKIARYGDFTLTCKGILAPTGEHELSTYGMESLLRRLHVPVPKAYAFKVVNEHLLYDVNNLLNEDEREVQYRIENDVIVGFMHPGFHTIENMDIINTFTQSGFKVEQVQASPKYMRMRILTDNFIDVAQGDRTVFGLDVKNSDVGFSPLSSSLLMWRLICSNGAIGMGLSHTYRQEQIDREEQTIMEGFFDRIKSYSWSIPEITAALQTLTDKSNIDLNLTPGRTHVIDSENPIVDERPVVGFDSVAYLLRSIVGKKDALSILEGFNDDTSQYDTYNAITDAAKQYGVDKAVKLEQLGGRIIRNNIIKIAA